MSSQVKILIADDEPLISESIKVLLGGFDYEIHTCASGKEVLQYIEEYNIDLVLLDVVMPDMDGYQVLSHINKADSDILVIIMTGHVTVESAVNALRNGAYDYLRKPMEHEELLKTVENAVRFIKLKKDNKRIESALRNSEEKFRSLFDLSPLAIAVNEMKTGIFIDVNDKLCKLTQFSKDELIGRSAVDLNFFSEKVSNKILKVKSTWEGTQGLELGLNIKDGSVINVLIFARTIQMGNEKYILSMLYDVTDRRQLEERLKQGQRMEAIGTLAGGIAHEFNNALVGVTGNIELLQMSLPKDDNVLKYVKPMKDSSRRMADLTNKLLAYARGGKYHTKNISMRDFVNETLTFLTSELDQGISVETDLPRGISDVQADMTQLEMVLSAVLNNAAEAIEGEGRIRTIITETDVGEMKARTIPGLEAGLFVCLAVEDDGKGMDEETKNRIFDPFFTTKFQGRGLGMAAVYGIVKNHGGFVEIQSEVGKGTTIRIYLPASYSSEKEIVEPKTEVTMGSGTVLVIEDEETVMDVTQAMLEGLGYSVVQATTGTEAIKIVETFNADIDLIFLDIKLPDMEGGKIYPIIKKTRPDTKVIVCSGYSIDGPAKSILDAGAHAFLQKPYSLHQISDKIREVSLFSAETHP